MRAVVKAESVPLRAPIYVTNDINNTLEEVDDISWKVLGGGVEANVYDLTRFGIKLLNGEIISDEAKSAMWTPPDSGTSNYAFGWDTATATDKFGVSVDVMSKQGGADGSSSYFRVIPEKGIVITVVTNRRMWVDGGQTSPIRQLAADITAAMLANY